MTQVDRKNYLKQDCKEKPYDKCPIAIGWGTYISHPQDHANTLEQLK